jgi:uncharacterized protein
MAVGNTFGATALSSYGGFWLSFAVVLTPGGFQIVESLEAAGGVDAFHNSFGFFLYVSYSIAYPHTGYHYSCTEIIVQGWFIFTTILLVCTLKSTVAFFSLFFTLDIAFLCLATAYITPDAAGKPNHGLTIAGGVFGLMTAFLAWYNALAGIANTSNRYVRSSFQTAILLSIVSR